MKWPLNNCVLQLSRFTCLYLLMCNLSSPDKNNQEFAFTLLPNNYLKLSLVFQSFVWVIPHLFWMSSCLIWVGHYEKCLCAKSLQSHLTLCDPMDCSLLDSSVHEILQAKVLDWVAMPSSKGSFQPRGKTHTHLLHLLHWQVGSSPLVPSGKPPSILRYRCSEFRSYVRSTKSKTQAESSLRYQQKAYLLLSCISYWVTIIIIMPTWFMIVNVGKTNTI